MKHTLRQCYILKTLCSRVNQSTKIILFLIGIMKNKEVPQPNRDFFVLHAIPVTLVAFSIFIVQSISLCTQHSLNTVLKKIPGCFKKGCSIMCSTPC